MRTTEPGYHILCTTDFSALSQRAFHHALRLALLWPGRFTLLHVGGESRDRVSWHRFPPVLETLIRWQQLPASASKSQIAATLGIKVEKAAIRDEDPVLGIVDHLSQHPAELLVMGTEQFMRHRPPVLHSSSIAVRVLHQAQHPVLLLPAGSRGFVDGTTGSVTLSKILAPIDHEPDARAALAFAARIAALTGSEPVEGNALYVGNSAEAPTYVLGSTGTNLRWTKQSRPGRPERVIVEQAQALDCDLLIMAIAAKRGLREQLLGSTFDRILRHLKCPILALPTKAGFD